MVMGNVYKGQMETEQEWEEVSEREWKASHLYMKR